MISNRKAKKLMARGERIQKIAMKSIDAYRRERKNIPVNRTSEALADLWWQWEAEAIDARLWSYAY